MTQGTMTEAKIYVERENSTDGLMDELEISVRGLTVVDPRMDDPDCVYDITASYNGNPFELIGDEFEMAASVLSDQARDDSEDPWGED